MWKGRILDNLAKPREAHREAEMIRTKLITDTTISSSHLDFVKAITGTLKLFLPDIQSIYLYL